LTSSRRVLVRLDQADRRFGRAGVLRRGRRVRA
jgi:hypothetical protein